MIEVSQEVEVTKRDGREWLERSLAAGFDIATVVRRATSFHEGRFITFVPPDATTNAVRFPEHGFVGETVGNAGLARFLDGLAKKGGACIIVEDDILERGDRQPEDMTIPSAFIGDGVIHWSDLGPGAGLAATRAIREGAFGYPLNAFVTAKSATTLGLANDQPVPAHLAREVANCLLAVIVSAFDGESFLVWAPTTS